MGLQFVGTCQGFAKGAAASRPPVCWVVPGQRIEAIKADQLIDKTKPSWLLGVTETKTQMSKGLDFPFAASGAGVVHLKEKQHREFPH